MRRQKREEREEYSFREERSLWDLNVNCNWKKHFIQSKIIFLKKEAHETHSGLAFLWEGLSPAPAFTSSCALLLRLLPAKIPRKASLSPIPRSASSGVGSQARLPGAPVPNPPWPPPLHSANWLTTTNFSFLRALLTQHTAPPSLGKSVSAWR